MFTQYVLLAGIKFRTLETMSKHRLVLYLLNYSNSSCTTVWLEVAVGETSGSTLGCTLKEEHGLQITFLTLLRDCLTYLFISSFLVMYTIGLLAEFIEIMI